MAKDKIIALGMCAAVAAASLAGGIVGYTMMPTKEVVKPVVVEKPVVKTVTVEKEVPVEKIVKVQDTAALDACKAELEELKQFVEENRGVLEIGELEAEARDEAFKYLLKKDYKLMGFLNDEFGLNIEDEDDMTVESPEDVKYVTNLEDKEVEQIEFVVKVKYFENGDEDDDGRKYVKVTVVFDDGMPDGISFERA